MSMHNALSLSFHDAVSTPDRITAAQRAHGAEPLRELPSQALLGGNKAVEIVHNGLRYKLQATRLGKLILTK